MPKYPYFCAHCDRTFDIIKPYKEIDRNEQCDCGAVLDSSCRRIGGGTYFIGEKVEDAEYNPGLGCIVKSKAHRRQICKERGLIEVGNDYDPVKQQRDIDRAEAKRSEALAEGIRTCLN